jgi:hypothetical protein
MDAQCSKYRRQQHRAGHSMPASTSQPATHDWPTAVRKKGFHWFNTTPEQQQPHLQLPIICIRWNGQQCSPKAQIQLAAAMRRHITQQAHRIRHWHAPWRNLPRCAVLLLLLLAAMAAAAVGCCRCKRDVSAQQYHVLSASFCGTQRLQLVLQVRIVQQQQQQQQWQQQQ